MPRYGDLEHIEKFVSDMINRSEIGYAGVQILSELYAMPTADVAPVIHAKWETVTVERARSVCGENTKIQYKRCGNCKKPMGLSGDEYCGTCGARMDLKEGENDGTVD